MKASKKNAVKPFKLELKEDEIKYILKNVDKVLRGGWLTLGKYSQKFEENFASIIGTKYAVAVNSGTSALEIILRILDVKNEKVLIPVNSNFATAIAALNAGAQPVFYDNGLYPDFRNIEEKAKQHPKAIIVVHIGGYVTEELVKISEHCRNNGIFLIEDASHSHGTALSGKKTGSFGIAGAFSFFPTKPITTCEGGVITTDDKSIFSLGKEYRDQGKRSSDGLHIHHGNSWRMSELHAIVGLAQLNSLVKENILRTKIIGAYQKLLADCPAVSFPILSASHRPSGYKCIAYLKTAKVKKALKEYLTKKNIHLAQGVYDRPLHKHPFFFEIVNGKFPMAEDFSKRHICLPIWDSITPNEIESVVFAIKSFFSN